MTDDDFHQLLVAEAKARLAKMTEQDLIDLMIAQYGQQMKSDLLELRQSEERERVRRPRSARDEWQRELAAHLEREDPEGTMTRLAKFRSLPREHVDAEEALWLRDGKWAVSRDKDGKIVCVEGDGRTKRISFATFERYLKKSS